MTNINNELLKLIIQNKTVNEIASEMHLTHKQIYRKILTLENLGYNIDRKYYYSGDMVYVLNKMIQDSTKNGVDIITSKEDKNIKLLIISDLHFGSKLQRLDLLDMIYNYCKKENINIIINAGDLIDGLETYNPKKIKNTDSQIDFLIKNYPFDKNILNFVCLGNHDYESLLENGKDFGKILRNKRHDIVPIGYSYGKINIKNDSFIVRHRIKNFNNEFNPNESSLVINGHSHKTIIDSRSNANIIVPSLSDIQFNKTLPGALKLNIDIDCGVFINCYIEQLILSDKIYKINRFYCDLGKNKSRTKEDFINLEEDIAHDYKVKAKQMVKNLHLQ